MDQIKKMASPKAAKAFVAMILVILSAAIFAAAEGFTLVEILTIIVAGITSFQATYWTPNETTYDGSIDVEQNASGKKVFSLNLDSNPEDLELSDAVTFKIVSH